MTGAKNQQPPLTALLAGLPGSGKGTQTARLEAKGAVRLATGDLLRAEIRRGSALGRQAERRLAAGHYMPDSVVQALIEERARQAAAEGRPMVFDGFPRTVAQYEWLKMFLGRLGRRIDAAIELDASDELVVKRLTGRLQCEGCGEVWHREHRLPKRAGVCDACGGKVAGRDDDRPEAVRERLVEFRRKTAPMLEALRRDGLLVKVAATGAPGAVAGRVTRALNAARRRAAGTAGA